MLERVGGGHPPYVGEGVAVQITDKEFRGNADWEHQANEGNGETLLFGTDLQVGMICLPKLTKREISSMKLTDQHEWFEVVRVQRTNLVRHTLIVRFNDGRLDVQEATQTKPFIVKVESITEKISLQERLANLLAEAAAEGDESGVKALKLVTEATMRIAASDGVITLPPEMGTGFAIEVEPGEDPVKALERALPRIKADIERRFLEHGPGPHGPNCMCDPDDGPGGVVGSLDDNPPRVI